MARSQKLRPEIGHQPPLARQEDRGFAFLKGKPCRNGRRRPVTIAPDYLDAASLAGYDEAEANLLYDKHFHGVATSREARRMAKILSELYKIRGIPDIPKTAD